MFIVWCLEGLDGLDGIDGLYDIEGLVFYSNP
jgi:hypothetical protein